MAALFLGGCATNYSDGGQSLKLQLGDCFQSDTNVMLGSTYELGIYVITRGDTLAKIAKQFHISLGKLESINPGLKPNRLRVGQIIMVYARKKN